MDTPQLGDEMIFTLVYALDIGNPGTLFHFQFLAGLEPSLKCYSGYWETAKSMLQRRDKRQQEPNIQRNLKSIVPFNLTPALLLQSPAFLLAQGNYHGPSSQSIKQMCLDVKSVGQPSYSMPTV